MNEKQIPLFDAGDRRILAVLFAAGEPLELERLAEGLGVDKAAMRQTLERLRGRLREAGLPFELLELEENVQLATAEEYGDLIRSVLSQKRSTPLSQSAMEVLAIVAYNQPVTRAFIEQVRGVDCGAVVQGLAAKNLIEEKGRLELPGRPLLYGTTADFLRCFGVSSLSELPPLPQKEEDGMMETTLDEVIEERRAEDAARE